MGLPNMESGGSYAFAKALLTRATGWAPRWLLRRLYPTQNLRESERMQRFSNEFSALRILIESVNQINTMHPGEVRLRGARPNRDLDQVVAGSFAKAAKSFYAINKLCSLGYGEDALILLRSNVNLMINLGYVLARDSPQRASDFTAHSVQVFIKYHNDTQRAVPTWCAEMDQNELNRRASRWARVTVKSRAKEVEGLYPYYAHLYTFYSSIEHSDGWALCRYLGRQGQGGPVIDIEPSDEIVATALRHNFLIMKSTLVLFCSHFGIAEPEIFARLDAVWQALATTADQIHPGSVGS